MVPEKSSTSVSTRNFWFFFTLFNWDLPSLSWLATPNLTLWWAEASSITTSIAITSGVGSPVSSQTLAIYPKLALAHATHVQSQWFVSIRCIKRGLNSFNVTKLKLHVSYSTRVYFHLICFVNCTLCHVRGCCFWAISEPCIQSTEGKPFGETRFIVSPLRPTCSWDDYQKPKRL